MCTNSILDLEYHSHPVVPNIITVAAGDHMTNNQNNRMMVIVMLILYCIKKDCVYANIMVIKLLNICLNLILVDSPSEYAVIDAGKDILSMSVKNGDPVTLHVSQLNGNELIVWRFGDEGKLIAKHDIETKSSSLYGAEERFKDRLRLNDQTGSLIITNTRTTDSGLYTVKISRNKQTSYKRFTVTVSGEELKCFEVMVVYQL